MYQINNTAAAIREVQTYLRLWGQKSEPPVRLAVDGIYGEETRAAVRRFQEELKLPATGETDSATFAALFEVYLALKAEQEASALLPAAVFPLTLGDSGSYIRMLQLLLAETEELPLAQDGFFGRDTDLAVRHAQRRHGMEPTGGVTSRLWRRLCEEYARRIEMAVSQPTEG